VVDVSGAAATVHPSTLALVDAAQTAAVRRVDRDTERGCLTIHRPARRDDHVGERDQALRVHRAVGDDHGR